ncbi:FtsX-like permease family protein [Extibacter muris]|uniref:FtsX-like permease family protein n=1 Tax=Extibacter muris TaxID=1796622 RepID=UPI001D075595|nr:FtsX-like permease family protein [Extibacter muris]MCB6200633.1 FtsX-like permease family protein [Extibacter muris]MCQ4663654.1 FtsX-like permease family protein [Extibacter muris]MCQ4692131.1 FtsX-like permease family protein [Extibacter muris]
MENRAKKFSFFIDRKGFRQKLRQAGKKKSFWITVVVITVLFLALVVGLIARAKGKSSQAVERTVQSATAEKGSISTTVAGTGTLQNGTTTDVVVPIGIKVKEVLVKSGDTVEEGQTLATLDEASIASELLELKESKESVQEQIDSLSSDVEDSGTTEYLEAKVLYGQMEELNAAEASLNTLLETKAVTASCAGTVDSVNVSADTEVTQSTASGTGVSSGDTASGAASGTGNESGTTGGTAVKGTIMLQFLIEALMISLMGCAAGIFLSWVTLQIISGVGGEDMNYTLSLGVVWISIAFSMGIGIIFGIYPANKAAKKQPIEALRYVG